MIIVLIDNRSNEKRAAQWLLCGEQLLRSFWVYLICHLRIAHSKLILLFFLISQMSLNSIHVKVTGCVRGDLGNALKVKVSMNKKQYP